VRFGAPARAAETASTPAIFIGTSSKTACVKNVRCCDPYRSAMRKTDESKGRSSGTPVALVVGRRKRRRAG
jgi:hypothetical protein